jgi:mono/diheme cytochrome c family protein
MPFRLVRRSWQSAPLFGVLWTTLFAAGAAMAEPSFAYKYKADCTLCHTAYPRLNRVGYEFRRLGYRFPSEVGKRANRAAPAAVALDSVPAANPADADAGRQLFPRLHCDSCHSAEGHGGGVGPALDGVAARRSRDYIAAQIARPQDHNPNSIMPAFSLSDEQMRQLIAYLNSLTARGSESAPSKFAPLNYLAVIYNPAIFLTQSGGNTNTTYDTRSMLLFLAGPLTDHLSMFVESDPAAPGTGFETKWNEAQGTLNFGGAANFSQTRFGQIFTLDGAGFGATDRFFSESLPLIYLPVNGFAAGRYESAGSTEYTLGMQTTLKAFGGVEVDGSRMFGGSWEQLIGKQGLSGFSVEFASGWNANLQSPYGQALHFERWYFLANKTFQDASEKERVNLMGGFSVSNDNQFIGGKTDQTSQGYGSFLELDTFPILRHLATYIRFDQLRPTTQYSQSAKAGTAGVAIDFTRHTRLLLEYQRFTEGTPSNFYTIGFWLNL